MWRGQTANVNWALTMWLKQLGPRRTEPPRFHSTSPTSIVPSLPTSNTHTHTRYIHIRMQCTGMNIYGRTVNAFPTVSSIITLDEAQCTQFVLTFGARSSALPLSEAQWDAKNMQNSSLANNYRGKFSGNRINQHRLNWNCLISRRVNKRKGINLRHWK